MIGSQMEVDQRLGRAVLRLTFVIAGRQGISPVQFWKLSDAGLLSGATPEWYGHLRSSFHAIEILHREVQHLCEAAALRQAPRSSLVHVELLALVNQLVFNHGRFRQGVRI